MAEKRTYSRLALRNLPANIPTKKPKEESNKNDTTSKRSEPLQKTSLMVKLSERSIISDDEVFPPLEEKLYKEGYQKDYIKFLLNDEKRFTLKRDFHQTTNYSTSSRYTFVNLLLKMQQYFKVPDNEYYMAVKLMDYSSNICVEPSEGVLLAITSFWLVHKFSDNDLLISLKSILKFSRQIPSIKRIYRKEDIIIMERRILSVTGFTIQLPDPSVFIEHFLRKLKLLQNKHIYHGTYFVCDCISMFPKFSYLQTSLVAAIALYTTLVVMKQDTSRFIQMTKNVFHEEHLRENSNDVISRILFINKTVEYKEPFVKHSVLERIGISVYFENYIKKINMHNDPE